MNNHACTKIIDNSDMIMMLRNLSKNGEVSITKDEFKGMVNKQASLSKIEKDEILKCVDSGTTEFIIDKPSNTGKNLRNGIFLSIKITGGGGRRSKTHRIKKGKRKGTRRRRRGHRRS